MFGEKDGFLIFYEFFVLVKVANVLSILFLPHKQP